LDFIQHPNFLKPVHFAKQLCFGDDVAMVSLQLYVWPNRVVFGHLMMEIHPTDKMQWL
jgi:hypothetical protein